jgi:5-hydroxyisourate hydrolase-like protein (transthyretin family)
MGEEVVTLVSERLTAGSYKYDWNANGLASGVYVYKFQTSDYIETKKIILLR